ncbi:MAG: F0F1 ATP synthase subunit A, partial [Vicinamibacteria bacterium]
MEQLEHKSFLFGILNQVLGGPVASLLTAIGFHVDPAHPVIPDHVIMAFFFAALLTAGAAWFRSRIRVEEPGRRQLALEALVSGLLGMLAENVGPKGRQFLGLVGTLGLFILVCNLAGLIPGLSSPTTNLNVTVGCALVSFLYYNYQGIRAHGLGSYLKHFLGPVLPLAVIMLPIEIISHISRVLSLSIRLFGNIFGEELVILVLASLIPFLVPLPMMAFAVFGSLLQAFVFIMLTMIYLGGAVAMEEH